MRRVLVVGAGFAGAVYARELAEAGLSVDVIDRRPHIAGNAYDYLHPTGIRVHLYGPHLFHTSNRHVVRWLSRFTEWIPYEHRVVARLGTGALVPMPINLDTINTFFGIDLETPDQVEAFLRSRAERVSPIASAADHLHSTIGRELTDTFYRPYTRKMWGLDLDEMDASVVRRLRVRTDRDDRYFPRDHFQALPTEGYTALFERLFDHPRIGLFLSEPFSAERLASYDHCFNSMPIDAYFDYSEGELPYRSIKFHPQLTDAALAPPHATINYTDDGPLIRETWWHRLPGHMRRPGTHVLKTAEEPCDYKDNNFERYYPVKTSDGRYQELYKTYRAKADRLDNMSFIGRCGTYQYLDMDQVINQSIVDCRKWMAEHLGGGGARGRD